MDIIRIKRLERVISRREELKLEYQKLTQPKIPIRNRVHKLHEDAKLFFHCERLSGWDRKKFVFVVLYLCAPQVLCGSRMPNGLRKMLSLEFGVNSGSVSNDCKDLMFLYETYGCFRSGTNEYFRHVMGILDG